MKKRRRILYVQYSNPAAYPCLDHSSRRLAEQGWDVLFLGAGAVGVETLRFTPHERISFQRMAYAAGGWRQKFCYAAFGIRVLWQTLLWKPDWIYVSDPLTCPVGLLLCLIPKLRSIYHEHDSPDHRGAGLFMKFVLWARRLFVQGCDLVIFPNESRAHHLKEEIKRGATIFCVPNFPSLEEIAPTRGPAKTDELWLLYHGSLVPSRLPMLLLDALALAPAVLKLRVVGYETIGHLGYMNQFLAHAKEKGLESRVQCIGAVPTREELLVRARQCDLGLALMPKQSDDINMQFMAGASNKPFDYLACGLALVVSKISDWQRMFVDSGYGLACDPEDPQSIADVLSWYAAHLPEMRAMGEKGRRHLEADWNYESAFQPVIDRLNAEVS